MADTGISSGSGTTLLKGENPFSGIDKPPHDLKSFIPGFITNNYKLEIVKCVSKNRRGCRLNRSSCIICGMTPLKVMSGFWRSLSPLLPNGRDGANRVPPTSP
jgi:hypothetical protein